MRIAPWEGVAINLIGPWKVKVNYQLVELNALTCIDKASNLVKLICVDHKTAKYIVGVDIVMGGTEYRPYLSWTDCKLRLKWIQ